MIYINDFCSISALGSSEKEIINSLSNPYEDRLHEVKGLLLNDKTSFFGEVKATLPDISEFKKHNSRNNAFLAYCVNALKDTIEYFKGKYSHERIGIVLGTSTSGLNEFELSLEKFNKTLDPEDKESFDIQAFGGPSVFLAKYLSLKGPAYTISTACSSSARALWSAKRLIEKDICDVVIAGGADTLCKVPINGFDCMSVLSYKRCIPFCKNRNGINIGEAAGLMVLSKEKAKLSLNGCGQSSDAYHISSPEPSGKGAIAAIYDALSDASLKLEDIGYINMHGTGTILNDAMESKAVATVFKDSVPCSSTKYLTGHTLGAAGILEACILASLLKHDLDLPVQDFSKDEIDDTLAKCNLVREKIKSKTDYMMSNSFAFGGNNSSIIIGRNHD